ncbi:hypothetical protein GMD78_15800 [Ornithinibacillus sp. L9]|uniref:Uncharacterized protein n=1 Tax=Ornithinibacillus caprae TaxID=2678566 RepID=A0A6N8FKD2_9BACI|nr:hypothetical protein [Ornithinibacillus caprae]
MTLLLKYFDDSIGFDEWKSLTNPDVFQLQVKEQAITLKRIWCEDKRTN